MAVLVSALVSAFITSSVRIRRVVSKRRDGGAAETNCANGEDQKRENLRVETFHKSEDIRREDYVSYSRDAWANRDCGTVGVCLHFWRLTKCSRRVPTMTPNRRTGYSY